MLVGPLVLAAWFSNQCITTQPASGVADPAFEQTSTTP
jgi:hypothetical protein